MRAPRSHQGNERAAPGVEVRKGPPIDHLFPEGTRRPVGCAGRAIRAASARSMSIAGCRVLPVALNSGLFWPRRTFMRYPGTAGRRISRSACRPGFSRIDFNAQVRHRDRRGHRPAGRSRAEQETGRSYFGPGVAVCPRTEGADITLSLASPSRRGGSGWLSCSIIIAS